MFSRNNNLPYKNILLIATRQIGDVLLTTPLLHSVRQAWPDAQIDVAVYEGKGGMLDGNRDLNSIIEFKERAGLASSISIIRKLFRKYDLTINTQAGDRAHIMSLLFGRTRVGCIVQGRKSEFWKYLINHKWVSLPLNGTHIVKQHLMLARALGLQEVPGITPPRKDHIIQEAPSSARTYAVIHVKPQWAYKEIPKPLWVSLIDHIGARGLEIVATGSPADREYIEDIAQAASYKINIFSSRSGFGDLSELLKNAAFFIGPDTSVTHLSAACGTPTLAIFGPTNPVQWGPLPQGIDFEGSPWQRRGTPWQLRENVLLYQASAPGEFDCLPCGKEGCDANKKSRSRCLDTLASEDIIRALDALIAANHKKPAIS